MQRRVTLEDILILVCNVRKLHRAQAHTVYWMHTLSVLVYSRSYDIGGVQ